MMHPEDGATLAELAKEALRTGQRDRAAALLNEARARPPRAPDTLYLLANIALVLHDEAAAVELLDAAVRARGDDPAPAAWYRILGETCVGQGKLGAAIHAFRAALAIDSNAPDTWRWLARVLRRVDDLPAAVSACRHAVELSPTDWAAQGDLAVVLMDMRAFEEAAASFDEAIARAGDVPALVVGRARLDAYCGRRSRAIAALEDCAAKNPSHVPALATLTLALRDEGRFGEAAGAFRRAIAAAPGEATFWCGLGRTLLEEGQAREALDVAVDFLQRRPGHAGGLALESLARLALGDEDGAHRLLDHDRFVVRRTLPVPAGYPDLATFNEALAAAAATHPTLHRAPLRHATAAGLHSGSLLVDPAPPIEAFQAALRVALDDYFQALPDWPEHPFVSRRPSSWSLDLWCVVMERGGHQIPHIHPEAWLSGVYYPLIPEGVRGGTGPGGWLAFGEPDRDFPSRVKRRIVHVRPEEGLLVLFPSYFFHRTIALDTEGPRISVAFDLVPR